MSKKIEGGLLEILKNVFDKSLTTIIKKILVKTQIPTPLLPRPQKFRINVCAKWQWNLQVTKQRVMKLIKSVISSV